MSKQDAEADARAAACEAISSKLLAALKGVGDEEGRINVSLLCDGLGFFIGTVASQMPASERVVLRVTTLAMRMVAARDEEGEDPA